MEQHERHEGARGRRAEIGMRAEQVAKVGGVLAEIGANGRFAFRAAIAFIEDQVENLVHGVEPIDQLAALGGSSRTLMVDQIEGGALKPLLDGFFGDQQRPSDFRDAEAAEGFECQGDLVFASERRMAAGEDHPELAVFDRRVEKEVVDSFASARADWRPIRASRGAESRCAAASREPCSWRRGEPRPTGCRESRGAPGLQGVEQRGLDHVFDEVEISPAEETSQNGHQSPRLAAEEMLHERSDRFRLCRGHGRLTTYWIAASLSPRAERARRGPEPRLYRRHQEPGQPLASSAAAAIVSALTIE